MKKTLLLILCLSSSVVLKAQLKVDSVGHVSIASTLSNIKPRLAVGDNCNNSACIGVSAAPEVKNNQCNVGVVGSVTANQSYSTDKNYGVYGVCGINNNHGRNYGVSGMLNFTPGDYPVGGAGVYAADYSYLFTNPVNIQGLYALYAYGPTNIHGQTIAQEIYSPADERLSENAELIEMQDRTEGQTLDNLLKMNVLEFRLKNHVGAKAIDNMDDLTETDRQAYEYMRKTEEKVYSRRHFGLSAQELQTIYPNLVLEGQDGYLYVNYTELVPILIRSIQELKAEVNELKGGLKYDVHGGDKAFQLNGNETEGKSNSIIVPLNVNGQAVGVKRTKK